MGSTRLLILCLLTLLLIVTVASVQKKNIKEPQVFGDSYYCNHCRSNYDCAYECGRNPVMRCLRHPGSATGVCAPSFGFRSQPPVDPEEEKAKKKQLKSKLSYQVFGDMDEEIEADDLDFWKLL